MVGCSTARQAVTQKIHLCGVPQFFAHGMIRMGVLLLMVLTHLTAAQETLWKIDAHGPDDGFGSLIRRASHDVDGDGVRDLLLGTPRLSDNQPGTVRVVSARSGETLYEVASDISGDGFGLAADTAGDLDGDGSIDLIVGAPYDTQGNARGGCVRIFSGTNAEELLRIVGEVAWRRLGQDVVGIDDVDSDGIPDFIVSEPGDPMRGEEPGYVMCLSGAEEGGLIWFAEGSSVYEEFGFSLSRLPDLDGDEVDDLVVGAPGARPPNASSKDATGSVVVLSGADGRVIFHSLNNATGRYGTLVASAGDINQDGFGDIITSDPTAAVLGIRSGRAWVLSGQSGDLLHAFFGRTPHGRFGCSIDGAGDVDGDGKDDLIIGSHGADEGGYGAGAAEVLSGENGQRLLKVSGEKPSMLLGYAVCGLGDINADGHADVAVGALQQGGPKATPGTVRAFPGGKDLVQKKSSPTEPEQSSGALKSPTQSKDL